MINKYRRDIYNTFFRWSSSFSNDKYSDYLCNRYITVYKLFNIKDND